MAPERVEITTSDLKAAWMVLENLAVSLDQIGSVFGDRATEGNGDNGQRTNQEALALAAYLSSDLVKAIGDARMRLGSYLADSEVEALTERIPYWNYATAPQGANEDG